VAKYAQERLTVGVLRNKPQLWGVYCGFIDENAFTFIVEILKSILFRYHLNWKVETVKIEEQLLLTLMKLRVNAPFEDLATRFGISRTTVDNIFNSIVPMLHEIIYVNLIQKTPYPFVMKNRISLTIVFSY
jgi:hypothetical protein